MQRSDRDVRTEVKRARELRSDATYPERALWSRLRNRRTAGLKFRRQFPVGACILDFYCEDAMLADEVDGDSHVGRGGADARRTAFLEERGIRVLRVTNEDVQRDIDAVLVAIARAAGASAE